MNENATAIVKAKLLEIEIQSEQAVLKEEIKRLVAENLEDIFEKITKSEDIEPEPVSEQNDLYFIKPKEEVRRNTAKFNELNFQSGDNDSQIQERL